MAVRRFEFVDDESSKFWEIDLEGTTVTVKFGKIGTKGQTKPKECDDEAAAQKEYDKLIKEKTKKGYAEVTSGGAPALAPAPAPAPAPVAAAPEEPKEKETKETKEKAPAKGKGKGKKADEAPPAEDAPPPKTTPAPAPVAAAAAAAPVAAAPTGKRRFTFEEGESSKFWEIDLEGKTITVSFGKIGSKGQTKPKEHPDEATARKEYDKLIKEKTKKGYAEVTS